MRLTDLNPRWTMDADIVVGGQVVHDGNRHGMGVSFDCPHCRLQERPSSLFSQVEIAVARALGTLRVSEDGCGWITPKPVARLGVFFANTIDGKPPSDDGLLWTRTGDTYETMSLSPSINAEASGHWHGWVTSGEAT